MENNLELMFYSGVGSVTGANFGLKSSVAGEISILVDCGLYQGPQFYEDKNYLNFNYNPSEVRSLLVTHAHTDHIGRIPKLVHDGFKGQIYSTLETKEIAKIMLEDALKFVLKEAKVTDTKPIYDKKDIEQAISLWRDIPYHQKFEIGGDFSGFFKDAGHILGSAIIEITYNGKKIAFSGDLGNSPTPFLHDTEAVTDASYLVLESVYGNRSHEGIELRRQKLQRVIEETIAQKGTLLIPAFSISRTQVLLHELNELIENKHLPEIPVFLDSPLAIEVTKVYQKYQENFKKSKKEQIAGGDKIFDFPGLKLTPEVEDSKAINNLVGPKVIIAGSGMSTGGRILHHQKRYLGDSKNSILFVGYQAPGTLGRIIQDGAKEVEIDGKKIFVKAKVETITGYSGHMDKDGLLDFAAKAAESGKLKKIYVVMGEPGARMFLAQRIKDYLEIDALAPEDGESFKLDF